MTKSEIKKLVEEFIRVYACGIDEDIYEYIDDDTVYSTARREAKYFFDDVLDLFYQHLRGLGYSAVEINKVFKYIDKHLLDLLDVFIDSYSSK